MTQKSCRKRQLFFLYLRMGILEVPNHTSVMKNLQLFLRKDSPIKILKVCFPFVFHLTLANALQKSISLLSRGKSIYGRVYILEIEKIRNLLYDSSDNHTFKVHKESKHHIGEYTVVKNLQKIWIMETHPSKNGYVSKNYEALLIGTFPPKSEYRNNQGFFFFSS